jgi:hypothetical protein
MSFNKRHYGKVVLRVFFECSRVALNHLKAPWIALICKALHAIMWGYLQAWNACDSFLADIASQGDEEHTLFVAVKEKPK